MMKIMKATHSWG